MKKIILGALFVVGTLLGSSGCYTPPPAVTVQTPPPATSVPPPTGYVSYAPSYCVWDGTEYVGVSGGNYVYWSGATWVVAPPIIVEHFHGWERYHPDWRRHALHYHHEYEHYR
jgi:hypothetical protein